MRLKELYRLRISDYALQIERTSTTNETEGALQITDFGFRFTDQAHLDARIRRLLQITHFRLPITDFMC